MGYRAYLCTKEDKCGMCLGKHFGYCGSCETMEDHISLKYLNSIGKWDEDENIISYGEFKPIILTQKEALIFFKKYYKEFDGDFEDDYFYEIIDWIKKQKEIILEVC